jgi:hypothetical protein
MHAAHKKLGRKILEVEKEWDRIGDKLIRLVDACPHPAGSLYKQYGANTGNYDPSQDWYWTDFYCRLCNERWTENGSSNKEAIEVSKYREVKEFPPRWTKKELE